MILSGKSVLFNDDREVITIVLVFTYRPIIIKKKGWMTVLMKSKARSTALASAVKTDESSGIRCILLWLSDTTAQPTFEPS